MRTRAGITPTSRVIRNYYERIEAFERQHVFNETSVRPAFESLCFVDTLDLAEGSQPHLGFVTETNAERVEREHKAPVTVVIGNPPYNARKINENDNSKNRKYDVVDRRVAETYAKGSKASNKNALSDPYVKFFRWASDRLQGRDGIVCFVSNNSFVDQHAFDGMRKHLLGDFTSIYHLDLHGNVRRNPKLSRTTHNVFGIQVGVGITLAVRKRGTSVRGTGVRGTRVSPVEVHASNHGQDAHATACGTGVSAVEEHGPGDHGQDAHATLKIRYGAYLPHWTRDGATYAVCFRLADSLPKPVIEAWKFERKDITRTAQQMNRPLNAQEQQRLDKLFSEKVEKYLDEGRGKCWLRRDEVAAVVATALKRFDGQRYRLIAWCVMPNHVHCVVQPLAAFELPDILHSWKSFSSKEANQLLGRSGQFWQSEYYDHLVRDEQDFFRQVEYVLTNPLRAGLKDWKWVGCGTGVPPVDAFDPEDHASNHG